MMHYRSFFICSLLLITSFSIQAARISDVANTKHNLSVTGPGSVRADSESQICVFCHTPHNAENIPAAPLWNRSLSGATYNTYSSNSMDATGLNQPAGSSKLCLSCHDGTLALGTVNVLNGKENVTVPLQGTGAGGTMPPGDGVQTGFTRYLGTDLSNDHPISFTYDSALASSDGELRDPQLESYIQNRVPGIKPVVPLESDKLQCISCHDPHLRDEDMTRNIKFLRLNRTQHLSPVGSNFNASGDIICLACHDKLGQAWAGSVHADPVVANEVYTDSAAAQRDFSSGIQVWEASCLNCHDTHTVQGSRRLLREGTDGVGVPKTGGSSAIEETCYLCHSMDGGTLTGQSGANFQVPNVKTDFLSARHMPINNTDQPAGDEQHNISNADFIESQTQLGKGNLNNRHVECTDCHNPHRLTKAAKFYEPGNAIAGTHDHTAGHSNIASGVLRGSWGVEPIYGSTSFMNNPAGYQVKSGDGGLGAGTAVNNTYVTREYQICIKCHSDFAYNTAPFLGDSGGGTALGTNQVTQYTNQAMEFQAPLSHKGELTAPGWATNNHRSWHPVIDDTGRTTAQRGNLDPSIFLSPWNGSADVGTQTMYCSDCHGSETAPGTVEPSGGVNGNPWGPHGSNKDFILKGDWDLNTGTGQSDDLCFKCHNYDDYANPNNSNPKQSGYRTSGGGGGGGGMGGGMGMGMGLPFAGTNLHIGHASRIGRIKCTWCHTSVPHGWKNKAFLVNRNDVGAEAGLAEGTHVSSPYTKGPYYQNAMLGISSWATSGQWMAGNCGGRMWMRMNCRNPP